MKSLTLAAVVLALSVGFASPSAFAEKGGKHDKEKGKPHATSRQGNRPPPQMNDGVRVEFRFGDKERRAVRGYYGGEARGGKCPPGLAKKGNGCMPPGQAKKWAMGRPLPRDVVYHDLPHDLLIRLPVPPAGHRYVQVAGDVLMIAVGSSMVVDAIQDILR